ncbi:MAG: type II toxin-antitoxin system RelE/ParE family toxin [Acidimicrobiales bacterium]
MDSAQPRAFVRLTNPAVADLERLVGVDPQIVRWALKKMLLLERDPDAGRPLLGDLIGWRKLVVGDRDWRIVWRVTTDEAGNHVIDIAEVWAVGARADAEVYDEMNDRIAVFGSSPTTQALSEVIERLGRAAGNIVAAAEPVHDPVPPWLVDRLVHQVRMTPEAVAELTGAQAMQAWEAFITAR